MIRVIRGNVAKKRIKKSLHLTKGFKGLSSRLSTFAVEQLVQAFNSSYKGRKLKKRNFHRNFLVELSKILKVLPLKYSVFIGELKKNNIFLTPKILSNFLLKKLINNLLI